MRLFVTGASGWIGSAVVPDLLAAGHTVVGLARSDASAARIEAAGGEVRRGDLDDLDALRAGAADSQGVVHLAFHHELAFGAGDFPAAAAKDDAAIRGMAAELAAGSPLVYASGVLGQKPGELLLESDLLPGPRANAELAVELAGTGVRTAVVRLSPTVHGRGDRGFLAKLFQLAREHGVAGYVDDGSARWPAVHHSDAATLVRLAAESAPAGSVLHGVAEEGVPVRDIAAAIAARLGVGTASVPAAEAEGHFGGLGRFFALDGPTSNAATRELLRWAPSGPTVLADLAAGAYDDSETDY